LNGVADVIESGVEENKWRGGFAIDPWEMLISPLEDSTKALFTKQLILTPTV
jgi:hypothetical protein